MKNNENTQSYDMGEFIAYTWIVAIMLLTGFIYPNFENRIENKTIVIYIAMTIVFILCGAAIVKKYTFKGVVYTALLPGSMFILFLRMDIGIIAVALNMGYSVYILSMNIIRTRKMSKERRRRYYKKNGISEILLKSAKFYLYCAFIIFLLRNAGIINAEHSENTDNTTNTVAVAANEQQADAGNEQNTPPFDNHALLEYKNAEIDRKTEILCSIYNFEKSYLGLKSDISISLKEMHDNTLKGECDHKNNHIYVNINIKDTADVIETLLHEICHVYQYELTKLNINNKLVYFKKIDIYKAELKYYKSKDNGDDYDEYYNQLLESDARKYASERKKIYLKVMQDPTLEIEKIPFEMPI